MSDKPATTLPPDFIDGLRHAADEGCGHTLQARYMRQAADEIEQQCSTINRLERALLRIRDGDLMIDGVEFEPWQIARDVLKEQTDVE